MSLMLKIKTLNTVRKSEIIDLPSPIKLSGITKSFNRDGRKLGWPTANNTDCNQLQSVQNVKKHICISEYINGMKSLRAETIYNQDSVYGKETTIIAYYINSGKEVIKAELIYNSDDNFRNSFEQLAKSIDLK